MTLVAKLRAYVFALAFVCSSCGAGLAAIIANAIAVADTAATWIDRIDEFVSRGPVSAETRDAIIKTRAAVERLEAVAQNADATREQLERARIELLAAYEALLALTRASGVKPATAEERARMAAAPDVLAVPTPAELAPKVEP